LLTITDSESDAVQMLLPKRDSAVILDGDIDKINTSTVSLNLVYRGICATSKAYLLAIEAQFPYFLFYFRYTLSMRPHGRYSQLYWQRHTVDPIHTLNLDHLIFVQLLIQTFCSLGICCDHTGIYPAYIAGMLGAYYIEEKLFICHLYRTKNEYAIFSTLLRKTNGYKIEPFDFRLTNEREYEIYHEYSPYEITYENVSLSFRIVLSMFL
jgi:hypothetical protein